MLGIPGIYHFSTCFSAYTLCQGYTRPTFYLQLSSAQLSLQWLREISLPLSFLVAAAKSAANKAEQEEEPMAAVQEEENDPAGEKNLVQFFVCVCVCRRKHASLSS